jgi:hypothetical protein
VLLALPQLRASAGVVYPAPALVIDARTIALALGAVGVATIVAVRAAGRAAVRFPVTTVLRGEAE